ncbi:hypothetical protein [Comamonas sp. JC664]|uniref:hypothetical protein n=1 Tax=Comamonas sp. JC664 TaxID=2801917 RepID=UPI00360858C1
MTNPLLDFSGLPRFDQVQPEHIAPAIDQLLAESEAALKTVTAPGTGWEFLTFLTTRPRRTRTSATPVTR